MERELTPQQETELRWLNERAEDRARDWEDFGDE